MLNISTLVAGNHIIFKFKNEWDSAGENEKQIDFYLKKKNRKHKGKLLKKFKKPLS